MEQKSTLPLTLAERVIKEAQLSAEQAGGAGAGQVGKSAQLSTQHVMSLALSDQQQQQQQQQGRQQGGELPQQGGGSSSSTAPAPVEAVPSRGASGRLSPRDMVTQDKAQQAQAVVPHLQQLPSAARHSNSLQSAATSAGGIGHELR